LLDSRPRAPRHATRATVARRPWIAIALAVVCSGTFVMAEPQAAAASVGGTATAPTSVAPTTAPAAIAPAQPVDEVASAPYATSATWWFGLSDPWAGRPFLSLPRASGQLRLTGDQNGRVIRGRTFRNMPVGVPAIYLYRVRNLTIDLVDLYTVSEGIVIYDSVDVKIRRVRARNIYGPYTRTTSHTGNLLQIVNSRRISVSDMKLDQPDTVPSGYSSWGTEDIISLGGDPGWGGDSWLKPLIIQRFVIDGGAWQSRSSSGIFVGDGDQGRYVWIRDGMLLNPGQVGIGTGAAGPYRFDRLDLMGLPRLYSNDSIQLRTSDALFGRVRIDWRRADGSRVYPRLDGHTYTNLGGNAFVTTLDAARIRSLAKP
jgi:hypothetical protein